MTQPADGAPAEPLTTGIRCVSLLGGPWARSSPWPHGAVRAGLLRVGQQSRGGRRRRDRRRRHSRRHQDRSPREAHPCARRTPRSLWRRSSRRTRTTARLLPDPRARQHPERRRLRRSILIRRPLMGVIIAPHGHRHALAPGPGSAQGLLARDLALGHSQPRARRDPDPADRVRSVAWLGATPSSSTALWRSPSPRPGG